MFGIVAGGYDDKQVNEDTWNIIYWGTSETNQETMHDYWLYHAAELTLEKGYVGFKVVDLMWFSAKSDPKLGTHTKLAANGAPLIFLPTYYPPARGSKYDGEIKLLKAPITPLPPDVFDATQFKTNARSIRDRTKVRERKYLRA